MDDDAQNGQGFQRELNENCMEYMIFQISKESDTRKYLSSLESLRKDALQKEKALAQDYIWQREQFNLELINEKGKFTSHVHIFNANTIPRSSLPPWPNRLWRRRGRRVANSLPPP